jgi:hypothetical protein
MLATEETSEVTQLPGAGLVAAYYYDPYPPRFAANLKALLAESRPMLMRLHPGVRYNMADEQLFPQVDLEGHVVALVGYDQSRHMVLLADPWEASSPGSPRAAVIEETEEEGTGTIVCDGTADFTTTPLPLPFTINVVPVGVDRVLVRATVSLALRGSLKLAVSTLSDVTLSIALPGGLELEDADRRRTVGDLGTGDSSVVEWRVRQTGAVDGHIRVAAAALAIGSEPYEFSDVVGGQASLAVRSVVTATEHTSVA